MMTSAKRGTLHFAVAVLVLAVSAAGLQVAKNRGWLQLIKKPLPIRKPLQDLDRGCVRPFEVAGSQRLNPEVVEELGTDEYVSWHLQAPPRSPAKSTQLFVTYYTGVQDQVPHVPEECLAMGAYTNDTDETIEFDLKQLGRRIPVRRLCFYPPQKTSDKVYVYYTFCVNGGFYPGREPVRLRMGDPREGHLYYSKVELSQEGIGEGELAAGDQQAAALLDGVLTELVKSHWPVAGSERGGVPAGGSSQ